MTTSEPTRRLLIPRPSKSLAPEQAVALLRKAAQLLLDAADTAQEDLETDDYWSSYEPARAWKDGFVNGFGGVSSDYVSLLPPDSGRAIAEWLRVEADIVQIRIDGDHGYWDVNATVHAAVYVAQAIVTAAGEQQQPAPEQQSAVSVSSQQCGHDDYHDAHEWADRPGTWCPGHSHADDQAGPEA